MGFIFNPSAGIVFQKFFDKKGADFIEGFLNKKNREHI